MIAKELHDYLAEYQYYYSSAANVQAGRYVKDGLAISSRRPTFGEPMSERYLCCTTFSAWVLETAGYEGIAYGSLELLNNSIKDRGWIVIDNLNDVEPGDICFWNDANGALAHTNVCAAREADGTLRYYDTGSTAGIRSFDPIEYRESSIRKFAFAYRPNDEIAKALGAGSIKDLKKDIEEYIDVSVTEGKYSVSVMNLDANEKITINNERVKSNGLIKLFIMATAYNEVKAGKLDESSIISDVERMIQTDSNAAANNLLTTIGDIENTDGTRDDQDIVKGVDKVNEYCRNNSYRNTKLEGKIEDGGNDQTYTTVEDVMKLLNKIFKNTCVNSTYSEKMLDILQHSSITDMIPSTLTDASVGNKTGEQSGIIQDSAIISTENANYIIVISAKDITNTENAKNIIREIANMINLYFEKYGGVLNNAENYQDDGIETRMNGDRVCYKLPSGQFQCPLNNLVEAREMLFELLGSSEKTQSHERLMRYLLYLLTGNDYGVTEFDFYEFLGEGGFTTVGAGDYIVDTTQSPKEIVITDRDTLSKAFSWYSRDEVLQQYVDWFLECQEKYHVNAVFAAAVAITESSAGTNIAIGGNNMFSISNGGAGNWNSYGTMEGSIEAFFRLINVEYFPRGQNSVSTIADDPSGDHCYCVPPDAWIANTVQYMTEMFKTAGINVSAYNDSGTEVQQWIANEAKNNGWSYNPMKHYCLKWVQDIYQAAGINLVRKACASEAATAWVDANDFNVPLGAMVFGTAAINIACPNCRI